MQAEGYAFEPYRLVGEEEEKEEQKEAEAVAERDEVDNYNI